MINSTFHPSDQRGHTRAGRLDSFHSFSFGEYYNPNQMGFGSLRVINDDLIVGGSGFPSHPHRNMEIITIPLAGGLLHEDTLGNKEVISPDMIQVMSAGSGLQHSEYNASENDPAAFLQIWIQPNIRDVSPRHEEKIIEYNPNTLVQLVSPDARDGSISIYQDVLLYRGRYTDTNLLNYTIQEGRGLYIFMISGTITINAEDSYNLGMRDALSLTGLGNVTIDISAGSDFLLFDVNI